MTGREEDQAARRLVDEFLANVQRETGSLKHRINRMANDLGDKLTEINPAFEVEFGWRPAETYAEKFVVHVGYPARTIEPTAAVVGEAL